MCTTATNAIGYELCAPVGGIGNVPTSGNVSNSTRPGTAGGENPPIVPFTGEAVGGRGVGLTAVVLVGFVGALVLA